MTIRRRSTRKDTWAPGSEPGARRRVLAAPGGLCSGKKRPEGAERDGALRIGLHFRTSEGVRRTRCMMSQFWTFSLRMSISEIGEPRVYLSAVAGSPFPVHLTTVGEEGFRRRSSYGCVGTVSAWRLGGTWRVSPFHRQAILA